MEKTKGADGQEANQVISTRPTAPSVHVVLFFTPAAYRSDYANGCLTLSFAARISVIEGCSVNARLIDSLVA